MLLRRLLSLFKRPPPKELPPIHLFDPAANRKLRLPGNKVSTTKYNIITFPFVFLFDQFRHVTNLYFLFIAILSLIDEIKALNPVTNVLPLVFVLCVSAVKEIIEDLRRFLADRSCNNARYTMLLPTTNDTTETTAARLRSGDLLELHSNDRIPADCIPISSSNEDGVVFVETAELDGETNLKEIFVATPLLTIPPTSLVGTLCAEYPNFDFHRYAATINLDQPEHLKVPLSAKNLLLAGAVIRNTERACCIVAHCGKHTKLALNQPPVRTKFAHTDRRLNQFVFSIFCFKVFLCVVVTILSYFFIDNAIKDSWYIVYDPTKSVGYFVMLIFFKYFGLLSYLIPISCAVSLEVAKFIQTMFMESDADFNINTINGAGEIVRQGMTAKTSILNDELGLVEYVLSDKTGTLTENTMRFAKASVGGVIYDAEELGDVVRRLYHIEHEQSIATILQATTDDVFYSSPTHITIKDASDAQATRLMEYLVLLAICNEANPKTVKATIRYQSQSPDEEALCLQATASGVSLYRRTQTELFISKFGELETIQLLAVFPFDSDRKRQSVLVRRQDGRIVCYTKGADTIVAERTRKEGAFAVTEEHLTAFGTTGLRTLLVGSKELDAETYDAWRERWDAANAAIDNRDALVADLMDEMEHDFTLLGATAIEDRLQDGVPETIEVLLRAGIHVWMITGDKVETAINIGLSCNLLKPNTRVFKLRNCDLDDCRVQIQAIDADMTTTEGPKGVVFEGGALIHCMHELLDDFKHVITKADVVICSRVTPLQKAEIAKTVKKATGKVVLTIGDGANDVPMINVGDIGVGLFGKEGTQAARSSDYALRKFRHLTKLVLHHGRQSLLRNVTLIKMCFYKNAAFFLILMWYAFLNGYSGQSIFEDFMMTFYNIFITSLPPVFIAVCDRDLPFHAIKDNPEVHREMLKGPRMSLASFIGWLAHGIWQSLLLVFILHFILEGDIFDASGRTGGWAVASAYLSIAGLMMVMATLATQVKTWNAPIVFSFVVSYLLCAIFVLLVYYFPGISSYNLSFNIPEIVLAQPAFYMIVLYATAVGVTPNVVRRCVRRQMKPTYYEILQEEYRRNNPEEYGQARRVVIEGTEEAHVFYATQTRARPRYAADVERTVEPIEMV